MIQILDFEGRVLTAASEVGSDDIIGYKGHGEGILYDEHFTEKNPASAIFMEYSPYRDALTIITEECKKIPELQIVRETRVNAFKKILNVAILLKRDKDILHCDWKLDNILCSDDMITIKVIDFGCAKMKGEYSPY